MNPVLDSLAGHLEEALAGKNVRLTRERDELTLEVAPDGLLAAAAILRDDARLKFEQLVDLAGVDYQDYGDGIWEGQRFAAVSHLLSPALNQRLRLKVFAADDDFPVLPSLVDVWPSVNWYEREAFDLFGIVFEGHPDLRRILTDYGFVGHPFRKDFPLTGNVEMRYDAEAGRVVYQPVTIEERVTVPRIIREENYGG